MAEINSNEYWNERFNNNWEKFNGIEQTEFFINLLLKKLPIWFNDKIKNNSFCDAGCAEGQGTFLLKKFFPNIDIEGIDFSEVAIEKARKNYPDLNFKKDDIYNLSNNYDVVVISNVLEHFEDPFFIIEKLLSKTNKHLIIMVPFQEKSREKEHFFTFDYENFPIKINDFVLSFFNEIDCRLIQNSMWNGKQAIIIYSKITEISNEIRLDSIKSQISNKKYIEENEELISILNSKVIELSQWGQSLENQISSKNELILDLNKKVDEVSHWGQSLNGEVIKRDEIILDLNQKIDEITAWGQSLNVEVTKRDEIILDLNQKINEISVWGQSLNDEIVKRDEIILDFNRKLEKYKNKEDDEEIQS